MDKYTPPNPNLPWPICLEGVELIARREGLSYRAYRCPAGVWTNGRGCTRGVGATDVWTLEECDSRLLAELIATARAVQRVCEVEPSEHQMAAMVSLAFNIGPSAFLKSTVLKAHNRGDFLAASRAFGLWNKATVNGVLTELAGLTARRAEEAAMYIDGNQPTSEKMPQAVAAESGISKSPIAQAGGVTAGLGVLGTVSQASDQVSTVDITVKTVKSFATDTLGIPANYFLPLVLIAAGAAVVYYRHRQRSQGWA